MPREFACPFCQMRIVTSVQPGLMVLCPGCGKHSSVPEDAAKTGDAPELLPETPDEAPPPPEIEAALPEDQVISACPNCSSQSLWLSEPVSSSTYTGDFLPSLGSYLASAQFGVVLCTECGLTRFFADEEARQNVAESGHWKKV